MKYKVSVIKLVTLVMIGALAVAMVACQAATPKPAEKGDQGDPGAPGEQGEQGPPGTTDNEPPMAVADKPFKDVYLALAGSGKRNPSGAIDPSAHFSDAEKAVLRYEAASSDMAVATVKVDAGKLTVTGKAAGMATVTVSAFDGVNTDPATASFDVMVVASNARPVVMLMGNRTAVTGNLPETPSSLLTAAAPVAGTPASEQRALRAKLYDKHGARKTEISAIIHAGNDTFEDEVSFEAFMGKNGKEDDIVSVKVTEKVGALNTWVVELDPIQSGMQNVYVVVTDKFGATAETPEDLIDKDGNVGTDADVFGGSADAEKVNQHDFQFVAFVNTKPTLDMPLPDKTFVGTVATATAIEAVTSDSQGGQFYDYMIAQHFSTDEKAPAEGPMIDSMEKLALAPGVATTATSGRLSGGSIRQVAAGTLANGDDRYNDVTCTAVTNKTTVVAVASLSDASTLIPSPNTANVRADRIRVVARGVGTDTVTITCRDGEHAETDTVTVTVRAARS